MDTNPRDLQRVVYSTSGSPEDLPYLDDALFEEPMTAEECEAEFLRLKEREKKRQEQVPKEAKKANKHYRPWESASNVASNTPPVISPVSSRLSAAHGETSGDPSTTLGMTPPANERIRYIADGVMKEKGLEKSDFLNEGGRHTTVKVFLSGATQLLTKEEANGILAELMPDHWQDENIQALVRKRPTAY